MPTITVELPDGLSIHQLVRTANAIERAARQTVGVLCETNIDISDLERSAHHEMLRDITRSAFTRPQELAADAMAAKHGRSRVRRLSDGAVEITGMLDDVERETVCVEPDGRERWRR